MCALSLFKKINKYLFTTIIIILLYLCCTSIAYADITVKTIPTNLVVNHTKDEMKIILEFNMNGGTATITDASSVDIFSYSLSSAGSSFGDGYRLIITITDTDLINDILSGADPIDITFPSGTISNGASDTNLSDIHVTVVTPPVGTSFDISDTNEFKATATLTTSGAGTHVVTFFNKADFELHYPDEYSYFDIVPKDIQYGKLVSWGPDIKQFKDTVTISGNSLSKDFSADAVDEKPYVGVYYTESPAGQAGATDYGAYLFMSSVAEGVENDGNSSGRPALIDPKRLMSYRFSDFQGPYNAYLIATFDNDIESNIFDNDSTSHLALGIDFKQDSGDPYISMRYPNNFDATINGKQLIIMMDDTRFGSDGKLFFQIPKGSIKDKATGKSNKDPITIVNNYDLNSDNNPRLFTHGAIELNSIDVTPYGNDADVELKLTGSGSVYNSYVPANEFDVTNLVDFATLMASATEDLDTEIFADNTTEYIGGLTSSSLMTTKLSDLQPETDYLWISTAMLISTLDGDGILEGHVTKFMTEPAQLGMEMMEIEYFTGDDSSVNDDDYVVVTYSEEFSNYGNDDDYNIWIDYDSNGSLDILLDTDDYTVSHDPQQLGPNQVKIEFEGDMETHLINILNATLKVEVKNPSNLEPVVQNGKHYQTVHIPNRIAKATNVRLINTSPALNLESNAFHQDDTYVFYSLLYSHLQTIEATGTIAVDKIDPLSTVNTSALTDYPVTATITAEEGHLTHTYELSINSNSALLEMITVNGDNLNNFSPYTKNYSVELAEGTSELPLVIGQFDSQITPTKTINYHTSGSLDDIYTVKVQVMNPDLPPNSTPELEYVLDFTVAPAQTMEMTAISYHTGLSADVNFDDYLIVTFSEALRNIGIESDYKLWIDYDSNGSLDQQLTSNDYTISTGQLPPNQLRIDFKGDMDTYLANIMNGQLQLEVINLNNLEPALISGKHSKTVHIPNRVARATSIQLTNASPELTFDPVNFNPNDTYLTYPMLFSHIQTLENTGVISVNKTDLLSTVNTSLLTDTPVTVTLTAEEGHLTHTYALNLSSDDSLLEMITVNGVNLNNFSPYTKNYSLELAEGTSELPVVIGQFDNQITPTKTINYHTSGSLDDIYTVKVQVMNPELPPNSTPELEYVLDFTVAPAQTMEMTAISYHTGLSADVNFDDYLIVTFSEALHNIGIESDYKLWIDYDSNGSLDQQLTSNDYTISTGQLPPNQLRIDFKGDMDTYLANIMNGQIKVEVVNLYNLEPALISGKQSKTTHIPNRVATATSIQLTNASPELTFAPVNFNPNDTYLTYPMLFSHIQTLENTGIISVNKTDLLSTVNTSLLTDTPVTVTLIAEEGHLTHTYQLNLSSDDSLLEMITVNGVNLNNFSPYTKNYSLELAEGTSELPVVIGQFDNQITPTKTINYHTSGSLDDIYTVTVQVMNPELPPNSAPKLEYVLNFTVVSSPDGNNSNDGTNNNDSSTSGDNSSSSSDKDKKSKNDSSVTSTISTNTGSLLDSIDDASNQADDTPADSIINLIDKIETPAGARIVLDKMPETLEDLMTMKASLDSLDDSLKMDADIAKLIAETERLISLLTQSKKSQQHVQNIITPLGEYYDSMNSGSLAANQVLVGSVAMTNASIEQAGTLHLNWSDVEIEGGRVYLTPSPRDITQAIRAANQIETSMENLLNESLTPGLSSGIISTITYEIPSTLENAAQTGVVLDEETINTLTSNNVGQVDLNMGPVTFGMDNNFLNNYSGTNLEFNVSNQGRMNEEESEGIPDGSSEIGAPVLDLTSFQNSALDEAFDRPIVIEFNLDYFGFTPIDDERLYIGRWNKELKTWDAVGGSYDGSKNTITANRTHLSKYTVLKSDKNYSTLEDSWAKNEIASLKNKGIIEDDSLFNGSENITREEFACWVSKAYGLDATNLTEDGLGIDTNSAYYEELQSLYSEAQVSGAPPNQFDSELTKEELAVLIANALDSYDRPIDTDAFELAKYEEDLPTWAVNSVETVVENGVVDESFFGSAGAVTKEEAANILYQVYN